MKSFNKESLYKTAQSLYKAGMYVDQTTAYNGIGSKTIMIENNEINIRENERYINVAVGGVGVYNSMYSKWANIVNKQGLLNFGNYEIY